MKAIMTLISVETPFKAAVPRNRRPGIPPMVIRSGPDRTASRRAQERERQQWQKAGAVYAEGCRAEDHAPNLASVRGLHKGPKCGRLKYSMGP